MQEVPELSTHAVLLVHHTDCGAQAAMRHHDLLVDRMRELLGQYSVLTWLVQVGGRRPCTADTSVVVEQRVVAEASACGCCDACCCVL